MDSQGAAGQLDDAVSVLRSSVRQEATTDQAFAHKRFFKSERARRWIHKFAAELVEADQTRFRFEKVAQDLLNAGERKAAP